MIKKLTFVLVFAANTIFALETIVNNELSNCGLDEQSIELAKLIIESSGQQRKVLICDKTLAQAAQSRASDLAHDDEISHYVDHTTANEHLTNNGIKLPYDYNFFGNQVESVLGGKKTYQESFDYFMSSPAHKAHLLGETEFLASQDQIGVGYYMDKDKDYIHFWVVYITSFRSEDDKMREFKTGKPVFYFVPNEEEDTKGKKRKKIRPK